MPFSREARWSHLTNMLDYLCGSCDVTQCRLYFRPRTLSVGPQAICSVCEPISAHTQSPSLLIYWEHSRVPGRRVEIRNFDLLHLHLAPSVGGWPRSNFEKIFDIKVRGLSCGVVCVILHVTILVEIQLVMDRRTHDHDIYRESIAEASSRIWEGIVVGKGAWELDPRALPKQKRYGLSEVMRSVQVASGRPCQSALWLSAAAADTAGRARHGTGRSSSDKRCDQALSAEVPPMWSAPNVDTSSKCGHYSHA